MDFFVVRKGGLTGCTDLEMLGTLPEHQGRGAGSMLIKAGLDQADENGDAAYLEASKEGVSTYRRFGFEEVDQLDIEIQDQTFTNLCMLRKGKVME